MYGTVYTVLLSAQFIVQCTMYNKIYRCEAYVLRRGLCEACTQLNQRMIEAKTDLTGVTNGVSNLFEEFLFA